MPKLKAGFCFRLNFGNPPGCGLDGDTKMLYDGIYIIPKNGQIAFRLALVNILGRLICLVAFVISFVIFAYLTDIIDGLSVVFADQNAMFRGGLLMWFISSAFFLVWIMGCFDLLFLIGGTITLYSYAAGIIFWVCMKIDDLIRAEKITGRSFLAVFVFCLGVVVCNCFNEAGYMDYVALVSAFVGVFALVGSNLYVAARVLILAAIVSGLFFTNMQVDAPRANSCASANRMASIPAGEVSSFSPDELRAGSERGRFITVMGAHVLADAGREGVAYVARGLGSSAAFSFRPAARGAFRGLARNLKFLADQGKHLISMGIDATRGSAASQGKKLWHKGCTSAA